jgi:PPM family protein phosphatase
VKLAQVASVTDPGRRRRRNEDAFVCEPPLFAVADGMGGAQAGELASRLAAAALREEPNDRGGGEQRVASLIQEANRRVHQRASEDRSASGMGTTMTVALVEDGLVRIGHVGDSRAYLVREGALEQLTEDHSLVAELVRGGKLSPEEAETHPQRSVITRALGPDPDVDVDTFSVEARSGDLFLLCSDGLTTMVADEEILAVIEKNRDDLERAARRLVRAANRGGGEDNITIVFFEIGDTVGDTARLPQLDEAPTSRLDDDEDETLDELDAVPALDTVVAPPGRAEPWARGNGERPARERPAPASRPRRRLLLSVILGVVLVASSCVAALWGLSRAHFVGADDDGHVAVYQGVPYDVVAGVRLYRAVYVSPLLAAQLTRPERTRLFDHDLQSYDRALRRVRTFEQKVVP